MRILVMGAGAIGSVFGGLLARIGQDVTMIGRSQNMGAVQEHGVVISGIWGIHIIEDIATATRVEDIPADSSFEAILITTKAYDTASAVESVLPFVGPDTLVVSLQNGLGNLETITRLVGPERAVGGRVIFGVDMVEPGHPHITVYGGEVLLGTPGGVITESLLKLVDTITYAGIPTRAVDNIDAAIWGKALYNVSLNALSALLNVPYGALLNSDASRLLMETLINETFEVAHAANAPLLWRTTEEYRQVLFEELIPPTAAHYSSMHADLRKGKRTEIDSLNGAVLRLGWEHGIAAPVNATLTLLIKSAEGLTPPKEDR